MSHFLPGQGTCLKVDLILPLSCPKLSESWPIIASKSQFWERKNRNTDYGVGHYHPSQGTCHHKEEETVDLEISQISAFTKLFDSITTRRHNYIMTWLNDHMMIAWYVDFPSRPMICGGDIITCQWRCIKYILSGSESQTGSTCRLKERGWPQKSRPQCWAGICVLWAIPIILSILDIWLS